MGKKQRIERLERMLSGSNGEVQTYEPYKGVFADLEEHHSRLKAVEHDVPGLAGEIDLLLRRVIKLEQATDPKVKLNVLQRMVKEAPSTEEWNTLTVDLAKAEARIKELEAEVGSLKEKMRTNANLLAAWRGEAVDQVAGNLARLSGLADKEGK